MVTRSQNTSEPSSMSGEDTPLQYFCKVFLMRLDGLLQAGSDLVEKFWRSFSCADYECLYIAEVLGDVILQDAKESTYRRFTVMSEMNVRYESEEVHDFHSSQYYWINYLMPCFGQAASL